MDKYRLGMLLFLSSEAIFFVLLIFAYIYYRGEWLGGDGVTAEVLNVPLTALFTVLLLSSSLTVWLAEHSLQRENRRMTRVWLLLTVGLGAAFLLGQAFEYAQLFAEGITIGTGLFGTTFFTLTGFHGLHVLGGLVALTILLGLTRYLRAPHSPALQTVSLYWHFVDIVWIAVFSVVYLWALFS